MHRNAGRRFLPSLEKTLDRLQKEARIELEGLEGPAKAAAIVDIHARTGDPLLVVCAEEDEAQALVQDLEFFLGLADTGGEFMGDRSLLALLPDDLSPYESRKYLPARIRQMQLLGGLYALTQPFRPRIAVTTAWGLMRRYIPKRFLEKSTEYVLAGADIERDEVLRRIVESGYVSSPIVEDPGTFSARGFILDVFSPLYEWPLRLEFFGDTLESIRSFDPNSQKSKAQLEEAFILPVREILMTPEIVSRGRETMAARAREEGRYDRRMQNMLLDLDQGIYSQDLDPYKPLFYEELAPLFAFLSSRTRLVLDDPTAIFTQIQDRRERMEVQFAERGEDEDLALEPRAYVLDADEIENRLEHTKRVLNHRLRFDAAKREDIRRFAWEGHETLKQELAGRRGKAEVLLPLVSRLRQWREESRRVFLVARTDSQLERLAALLEPHKIPLANWQEPFPSIWEKIGEESEGRAHLVKGTLGQGQIWPADGVVILCEEEIFGQVRKRRSVKVPKVDKEAFLSSLDEIEEGDFVVHVEFGIGVYRGLNHLEAGGVGNDYMLIEYLGNDKLYLPVTRLDKVQKYSGAGDQIPRLDRLGGARWKAMKQRVKASIQQMASELLKLQAERNAFGGFPFSPPDAYYREFEAAFPFDETPDQERAIKDVLKDMQSRRPMDRLVCGDVGFGKTEVAVRAAMKAVLDGKQVAVLVPTTVLAMQHGDTFAERLKNYPVTVETVSRFKLPKEQKEILKRAGEGKVDVLIGTHRLLSKDVNLPELGLLVVDEEQRFGVKHKERLKLMRKNVDVLTLTATPIPRTLNMAFVGVRDISIIQTPPMDRRSIRTFVSKFDEDLIRDAVTRELARGGQVFFVHNRVGSIEAMATLIRRLVPSARISIGHGQMSEKQLEDVMVDFVKRRTNVLVCTTIIESGIDIPSVNTLIVNRADMFGLSQLYQLRGRVGRGRERAYAYLLVPSPSNLTRDAQKRLSALMRFTELGSGFRIASHDLEIRGAGSLLGREQSGHIAAIGIDLYLELIEEAVQELKGERMASEIDPQMNMYFAAFLPNHMVEDQTLRLNFYKRLSAARNEERLNEIVEELEDRFGVLPEEAKNLVRTIELKIEVRKLNAAGIDLAPDRLNLQLGDACRLDPNYAIQKVSEKGSRFRLTPDMKLIRVFEEHEKKDPVASAKNILQDLVDYGIKGGH